MTMSHKIECISTINIFVACLTTNMIIVDEHPNTLRERSATPSYLTAMTGLQKSVEDRVRQENMFHICQTSHILSCLTVQIRVNGNQADICMCFMNIFQSFYPQWLNGIDHKIRSIFKIRVGPYIFAK